MITGEGKPLLSPTWPSRGIFEDAHGLPFDRLMDAANGKQFGAETKGDREQAKRARKEKGSKVESAYHAETNIDIGLIVQDSVYLEWLVAGEARHHVGLAARFLITFAQGRMVGELKHRRFNDSIFRPFVEGMFEAILKKWSPCHLDILEVGEHCGVFTLEDGEERFLKNIRVLCKHAEGSKNVSRHRKYISGLSKVGYWVPLVGWENELLGFGVDKCLGRKATTDNLIHFDALRGASQFAWQRFATGQNVLDTDISMLNSNARDRDANRSKSQLRVRLMLLQCPAHVLTLPLLGTFCSPTFDALKSRTPAIHSPARKEVRELFGKMEEWRLGRIIGEGANLAFQKLHSSALPGFAREFLTNDLRVPLWLFGAHLQPPSDASITAHNIRMTGIGGEEHERDLQRSQSANVSGHANARDNAIGNTTSLMLSLQVCRLTEASRKEAARAER